MEEWLRPRKREVKKKDPNAASTPVKEKATPKKGAAGSVKAEVEEEALRQINDEFEASQSAMPSKKRSSVMKKAKPIKKKELEAVPTPSTSEDEGDEELYLGEEDKANVPVKAAAKAPKGARTSKRTNRVSYAEADGSD
jgi:UV DNA damage endonuclease